jgi:23S rRNA pseudouridine1911/1915/1917 synthase
VKRLVSTVEEADDKARLDRYLASVQPDISRTAIQRWIKEGRVTVAGEVAGRASLRVRTGDAVSWEIPEAPVLTPAPIPLRILYEDESLVALDKPVDLVVHPGAGTDEPTLVEGLLAARDLPESDDPSRPGIVHRLDKGTSGVIVVAKTDAALADLQRQFAERVVAKTYVALVAGILEEDEGRIEAPIGRDPRRPSRMDVVPTGKPAETEFRVLERLSETTLVAASPRTGRTHQIRAHFRYIRHPVVGDDTYGGPPAERMLLHAWRLILHHPRTGEELRFEAPVPDAFPAYPYDELPWSRIPEAKEPATRE